MKTEKRNKLREIYVSYEEGSEHAGKAFDKLTDDQVFDLEVKYYQKILPTVAELRSQGHKVKVTHHRKVKQIGTNSLADWREIQCDPSAFEAKEGKTFVEVTSPDGTVKTGYSKCSRSDNFNRKTGLYISLAKAFGAYLS